ncbi:acyltransferase family protein [Brucella anthropi]|uniref:acyltransferase family protein n=1 Tax=Brucella anthropi TaxID=529 RepID=UPI000F68C257|nr:acyltransferase [Brucella anthropi]RRY11412.1 acyltransferase [Brucella anthropi]
MATFNTFIVFAVIAIWLVGLIGYASTRKAVKNNDKSFNNSYNLIRFVAACMVLYSHHFPLAGLDEPRVPGYGAAIGSVAVHIFFALSGFLIYQSLQRNNSFSAFISARTLRICPNLIFAVVITSVLMMLWFDNFKNYQAHITYAVHNATSFARVPIYGIEGVLSGRPSEAVNGSLWTLQYEVFLYFILFALCFFAKISRTLIMLLLIISLTPFFNSMQKDISLLSFQLNTHYLSLLGTSFLTGSLLAAYWKDLFPYKTWMTLIALFSMTPFVILGVDGSPIFYALAAIAVITVGSFRFGTWFDRYGDGSYGIYIFAFPVQQLCLIAIDDFWLSMAIAFAITTLIGYTTWHLFEERALRARKPLSTVLDNLTLSLRKLKSP